MSASGPRQPIVHYDTPSVTVNDRDYFPMMCSDPACECQKERLRREAWADEQRK